MCGRTPFIFFELVGVHGDVHDRHPQMLAHHLLLHERVVERALGVGQRGAAGAQPLVGLGVLPVHAVGRRDVLRVEIEVHQLARRQIGHRHGPQLVVLLAHLGWRDRGVEAHDLPVDADLAHVALDRLGNAREVGDLRVQHAGRELDAVLLADAVTADLPAGLVEQLLCALDILLDDALGLFRQNRAPWDR